MVPFDSPVLTSSRVPLGSWMNWTTSARNKRSGSAYALRTSPNLRAGGGADAVSLMVAASMARCLCRENSGPAGRPGHGPRPAQPMTSALGLDHLVEDQLPILDAGSAL